MFAPKDRIGFETPHMQIFQKHDKPNGGTVAEHFKTASAKPFDF